jgi:hypothetical protein
MGGREAEGRGNSRRRLVLRLRQCTMQEPAAKKEGLVVQAGAKGERLAAQCAEAAQPPAEALPGDVGGHTHVQAQQGNSFELFNYTQECSRGHAAKAEDTLKERTPGRGRRAKPEHVQLKELLLGGGAIYSDVDNCRAKTILMAIRRRKSRYSDKAGCEQQYKDEVAKERVLCTALHAYAARLLCGPCVSKHSFLLLPWLLLLLLLSLLQEGKECQHLLPELLPLLVPLLPRLLLLLLMMPVLALTARPSLRRGGGGVLVVRLEKRTGEGPSLR